MNSAREIPVREAQEGDAAALLELQLALDCQSSMMMLEVGERSATEAEVLGHVRSVLARANSTILLAEVDGQLAGYVEAEGGTFRRTRHSAYVVAGVRGEAQGQGVGTALMEALERWARSSGLVRLELTVRVDNHRARRLYERAGYETEGVRRASLLVDGELVDELTLARLLQ